MSRSLIFTIVLLCIRSMAPSPVQAQEDTVIAPEGMKSPSRAFLYSFFGTAIPVCVGGGAALGQNELSPGAMVAIGGALVGPSLGHFYARRNGRAIRGVLIRGAALGIVAVAVSSASETEADPGAAVLFAGGFILGIVSLVADIAGASHSASVHNEGIAERARIGVAPLAGPVAGAPGVGVRLAF